MPTERPTYAKLKWPSRAERDNAYAKMLRHYPNYPTGFQGFTYSKVGADEIDMDITTMVTNPVANLKRYKLGNYKVVTMREEADFSTSISRGKKPDDGRKFRVKLKVNKGQGEGGGDELVITGRDEDIIKYAIAHLNASPRIRDLGTLDLDINEEAPANATGSAVAGTGDDSSTVLVKRRKELQKRLLRRFKINETLNKVLPDPVIKEDEITTRTNQLKNLAKNRDV